MFLSGALLLTSRVALADDWQLIGLLQREGESRAAELSLSLPHLNKRSGHHEIWERLRYPDTRPEQKTLWAVRCRAGALAKVLEASDGEFSARADPLRFYIPLPDSAGAAIVALACKELKRRLEETRPPRSTVSGESAQDVFTLLRPPSFLDEGDYDQDDD